MIEIISFILSGLIMLIIILFAKPDYSNQISTAQAALFWISATIFVVSGFVIIY